MNHGSSAMSTSARAILPAAIALLVVLFTGLPSGVTRAQSAPASNSASGYHLDVGDKVKVTVYGEDDLSGEFQIDGSGNVDLPMTGPVHAAGMTIESFTSAVQQKLKDGHFLVNPRVSAQVTNYRPFTILGEVNKPGEYPYENGMSILNAVAVAGGWTYRADENTVYVLRKGSTHEIPVAADDRALVDPGDTIRVAERIF